MGTRIDGLRMECDLLAADIQLCESGERREYDYGPGGARIDITDVWLDQMRATLALKRSVIRRLRQKYAALGIAEGEQAGDKAPARRQRAMAAAPPAK